jgi:hypothetical protein
MKSVCICFVHMVTNKQSADCLSEAISRLDSDPASGNMRNWEPMVVPSAQVGLDFPVQVPGVTLSEGMHVVRDVKLSCLNKSESKHHVIFVLQWNIWKVSFLHSQCCVTRDA